jgi:TRAP-type C4-dicarboxylate transport system permease small subunit
MKWIDTAAGFLNRMSAGMLFAMMLLTLADVVLRKVFSRGILGTLELTEFMMAGVIFLALAQTERLDRNVHMDLVMRRFGPRTRSLASMITRMICFLFCAVITASTLIYARAIGTSGEVSLDLWIPKYPFIYAVAAGWACLGLVFLKKCLAAFREVMTAWSP